MLRKILLLMTLLAPFMTAGADEASAMCVYNKTNEHKPMQIAGSVKISNGPFGYANFTVNPGERGCTRGTGGDFKFSLLREVPGKNYQVGSPRACEGHVSDHGTVTVRTVDGRFKCGGGLSCPGGTYYNGIRIECEVNG